MRANKCPRCGLITQAARCTCGSPTKLVPSHNLRDMGVDVTLTLHFDHDNQLFILAQKLSGQSYILLTNQDR